MSSFYGLSTSNKLWFPIPATTREDSYFFLLNPSASASILPLAHPGHYLTHLYLDSYSTRDLPSLTILDLFP